MEYTMAIFSLLAPWCKNYPGLNYVPIQECVQRRVKCLDDPKCADSVLLPPWTRDKYYNLKLQELKR